MQAGAIPEFYQDDAQVGWVTSQMVASGCTVLQAYQQSPIERDHVAWLLGQMDPPKDAHVIDAGSGVGAVARMMHDIRSDLTFTLLNISASQLTLSPDFKKVQGSFECMPLPADCADVVMFNYSLGHGDLSKALAESARVLRASGSLFIYDMDGPVTELPGMDYRIYGAARINTEAHREGFNLQIAYRYPRAAFYTSHMLPVATADQVHAVFGAVDPLVMRFNLEKLS